MSLTHRSLTHRAPLLGLVIAWAAGSAAVHGGYVAIPEGWLVILAVTGLTAAWLASRLPARKTTVFAGGLALALAAAGALRTTQERARIHDWDRLALPPREARLELEIERSFAARDAGRATGIARVVAAPHPLAELRGQRIHFSTTWPADADAPVRGMRFDALGLLVPLPFAPERGGFERFLADEGANFSFTRARREGEVRPANPWRRLCATLSARMEKILRAGLDGNERLADMHVAMLLGQKQALSLEQKDWFVRSGTMHLFAVSGLHIAAIGLAINTLLALVRLPPRPRFLTGTSLLWLYVEITGGEPSAVRAFWMITCLLGARQLRAPANSVSALAASALGVLVLAPHQLFGAGFQMSYGIVAALLLYGVPLQEKWLEAWQPWQNLPLDARDWRHHAIEGAGRFLLSLLALGLASTLVSTPATLAFFELLAPGGFFVNLVLIPISSFVLFAGIGSLLFGLVGLTPIAVFFNHAAALVLAVMEWCVATALKVPGASWPACFAPTWMATFSGILVLVILALGYIARWPRRAGGYRTPYVVLVLILIFGVNHGKTGAQAEVRPQENPPLSRRVEVERAKAAGDSAQTASEAPPGVTVPVSAEFSTTWSTMP